MKQILYIGLLFALVSCDRTDSVSHNSVEYERSPYYQKCRQAERESLRWKAMAQCRRNGWNERIGGGCEHLNPRIPMEMDGDALVIYELHVIEEQIEKALEYCEVFRQI